jgi:hypothetical protein
VNVEKVIARVMPALAALTLVVVPVTVPTTGCAGPPPFPPADWFTIPTTTPPPAPVVVPPVLPPVVLPAIPLVVLPAIPPVVLPAPAPAPPAPASPVRGRYPGEVLDLSNWYLTLPTGEERDPDDIYQPRLTTYLGSHFYPNSTGDGVVFTANAGGVTTSGSSYPRSELREMTGDRKAGWSNRSGTHTLCVRQAITRLPQVRPHLVAAQIHDADDDVMLVRLEGGRLLVEYEDGDREVVIDPAYRLGTPYDLRIVAAASRVQVYYNGRLGAEIPESGSGWYFKAGSYLQSNPDKGDDPDAVGEVVIYSLQVTHTG